VFHVKLKALRKLVAVESPYRNVFGKERATHTGTFSKYLP
jgi:hypothetical protein